MKKIKKLTLRVNIYFHSIRWNLDRIRSIFTLHPYLNLCLLWSPINWFHSLGRPCIWCPTSPPDACWFLASVDRYRQCYGLYCPYPVRYLSRLGSFRLLRRVSANSRSIPSDAWQLRQRCYGCVQPNAELDESSHWLAWKVWYMQTHMIYEQIHILVWLHICIYICIYLYIYVRTHSLTHSLKISFIGSLPQILWDKICYFFYALFDAITGRISW